MNFSGIGGLRRIKPFVSQGSLVALDRSLIQPYFDYCSLLDTCDKRDKLQILKNRAPMVITGPRSRQGYRSSEFLKIVG